MKAETSTLHMDMMQKLRKVLVQSLYLSSLYLRQTFFISSCIETTEAVRAGLGHYKWETQDNWIVDLRLFPFCPLHEEKWALNFPDSMSKREHN